jgi:hypothetical protein
MEYDVVYLVYVVAGIGTKKRRSRGWWWKDERVFCGTFVGANK